MQWDPPVWQKLYWAPINDEILSYKKGRKHTIHDAVSLISRQSLKKTAGREKEKDMEGDEVVNSTAVCLHLSTH